VPTRSRKPARPPAAATRATRATRAASPPAADGAPTAAMRAQILDAATRLFAARGFDGTALQDIADAVGIRKPSLLYHFPSKDALRHGVLEQMVTHWKDVLPRVLLAATSGEGQFEGVLGAMLEFFDASPDRARLLMREVLDRPHEMAGLAMQHVRPWVEVVANYIRKGQKQGLVRPDVDPEAYTIQVIIMLVGSVANRDALGTLPADRNRREILRFARAALFVNPAPTTAAAEE
jgi:AcrR family transcriptional regulator